MQVRILSSALMKTISEKCDNCFSINKIDVNYATEAWDCVCCGQYHWLDDLSMQLYISCHNISEEIAAEHLKEGQPFFSNGYY